MKSDQLIIVYFIYIDYGSNWKKIISGQKAHLEKFGMLSDTEIFIQLTDTSIKDESQKYVKSQFPDAKIKVSHQNNFEYEAMKTVYETALQNPNRILAYFHTKGMSYKIRNRARVERTLFRLTFQNWKNIINLLKTNSKIHKAGLIPSLGGKHVWFNFWFAKTDYLSTLEEPFITEDRYYYEWWLGNSTNLTSNSNTFSIFDGDTKSGYDHNEASAIMYKLFHDEFRYSFFVEEKFEILCKFMQRGINFLKRKISKS